MPKRLTDEEFKIKFRTRFPNSKLKIDESEYKGGHDKMTVICLEHGKFKITPNDLIGGHGCPLCGRIHEKITDEEFKKKFFDKFPNSQLVLDEAHYNGSKNNITVRCQKHGTFDTTPNKLMNGIGCSKCARTYQYSEDEFKEEFFRKFPNSQLILDETHYVKSSKKITVICLEHGPFDTTPNKLLSGHGCDRCGGTYHYTPEEFKIEFHKRNPNSQLILDETHYTTAHNKVTVRCETHGTFEIRAYALLQGHGCAKCNKYNLEIEISNFLTDNNIEFEEQKRFNWLALQSLDFYLPQYNIVIECQGIQHFESVDHFGGDKQFVKQLELDKRKLDKCTKNKVKLLYYSNLGIDFPYHVFEDKEELLKTIKICDATLESK